MKDFLEFIFIIALTFPEGKHVRPIYEYCQYKIGALGKEMKTSSLSLNKLNPHHSSIFHSRGARSHPHILMYPRQMGLFIINNIFRLPRRVWKNKFLTFSEISE